MLHLVESIKRVFFFFLLLILLGIFFAKHEHSLQLFPFKVLPSSLWNGNLPTGDPFFSKTSFETMPTRHTELIYCIIVQSHNSCKIMFDIKL